MRSPVHAMLWEIWRVTRGEIAVRLTLGIVGSLIVLVAFAAFAPSEDAKRYEALVDFGAAIALVLLIVPHFIGWAFLARLNGGRAGFPLYLLYTRPVRTTVIVGVLMVYLVAVPSAIYLLSALLLRVITGYPFPLLPVAAWIAALTWIYLAATWSNRSKIIHNVAMTVASSAWIFVAMSRLTAVEIEGSFDWPPRLWPTLFDFPRSDYVLIAVIGLTSFCAAVVGVGRQRRGDAAAAWTPGAGFPEWFVNLLRFPCPSSSATRAQVWFELRSRGLPVLTIAVLLAITIPLLFVISGIIDAAFSGGISDMIASSLVALACFSSVIVAIGLAALNAFGIRRRWTDLLFDAPQPFGTARLAILKVLVRSACMLAALVVLGVSLRTTFALVPLEIANKFGSRIHIAGVPLRDWLHSIESGVAALSGYELLMLAAVVAIGVIVWVAGLAALFALLMRYSRRMGIAISLLLFYGLALSLLALAARSGIVPVSFIDALFSATRWIFAGAMVLATVYLFWNGFAQRVLTVRYAGGVLVISAVFVAAWVAVLHAVGVQFAGSMLTLVLLPLTISALAPWSLNRIRHM